MMCFAGCILRGMLCGLPQAGDAVRARKIIMCAPASSGVDPVASQGYVNLGFLAVARSSSCGREAA